jgi:sigma-B regulation protein RsbU (phosphoserine phosphatase)
MKSETRRRSRRAKKDFVTSLKWPESGFGSRIRKGVTFIAARRIRNILGYSPEEIIGKSYLDLLVDDGEERWVATTLQDGSVVSCRPFNHLVKRYRHKDGRDVYTESTGAPIIDEQQRLVKWRGVDHDITARKAYIDALRVRDRAIESVHVGIVISDAHASGNPNIHVSPALCQMTGYTRDELLGGSMRLLQGPETDPAAVRQIREALNNGEDCEVTLKNYRKNGAVF